MRLFNQTYRNIVSPILLIALLVGPSSCSNTKKPRLISANGLPAVKPTKIDGAPPEIEDIAVIPSVKPKIEIVGRRGNKSPYTVWGKKYNVMPTSKGYAETGYASWYGTKFHGRATSSGEIYDVYAMTAAHKHLPLPTYVEVTNLNNNKKIVVKVNDRGPFHGKRIIDLSYAAALKLGFADQGVAKVLVKALEPATYLANAVDKITKEPIVAANKRPYLQIGAFQDKQIASDIKQKINSLINEPVIIEAGQNEWHKVQIGPLRSVADLPQLKKKLEPITFESSLIVFK